MALRLRSLLLTATVFTLASQGLAQGCKGWNTNLFFLSATLAEVESCLAAGADVNARVAVLGYTPLHLAARFTNDPAVIEALLDAGADVNAQDVAGLTPFIYAEHRVALKGSDAYRRLSEAQTVVDPTSRASCAEWNTRAFFESATLEKVRSCLAAGADVNAQGDNGWTPLHLAAWFTDNPAIIRALVAAGAEVNARLAEFGDTPLHLAARFTNDPAVIEALLDAGAEVNARDDDGWTPLHLATSGDVDLAIVTALLDAGAEVNARGMYSVTPLHFAVTKSVAIVTALLDAGAEVNARAERGATPLHSAAANNTSSVIVTVLLNAGADVNAQGDNGWTPLHSAAANSTSSVIVTVLLDAGADATGRSDGGATPWDLAQNNEALKGTYAYRRLSEALGCSRRFDPDPESPAPAVAADIRDYRVVAEKDHSFGDRYRITLEIEVPGAQTDRERLRAMMAAAVERHRQNWPDAVSVRLWDSYENDGNYIENLTHLNSYDRIGGWKMGKRGNWQRVYGRCWLARSLGTDFATSSGLWYF